MDSATADTVSAQPELQLLRCLAAIANALNGDRQPRTFPAAVSRKEAKRQLEAASDLLSLLSAHRSCANLRPGDTQARRGVSCNWSNQQK